MISLIIVFFITLTELPQDGNIYGYLVGVITAVGLIIKYFLEARTKKIDSETQIIIERVKKDDEADAKKIELLTQKVIDLKKLLEDHYKIIENERKLKEKAERHLSAINVAFDLVYISLQDIIGNSPKEQQIMEKLKEHIDKGTGNTTPA